MRRAPLARVKPDVAGARRLLARNTLRIRRARGMTQLMAADRVDMDVRSWQKVEHAESNTTIATMARVAAALDTGIAELFATVGR